MTTPDTPAYELAEAFLLKRCIEADLRIVQDKINTLVPIVLDSMLTDGIQHIRMANGITLHIHKQLWARAKDGDMAAAAAALKEIGLGEFVKESFNVQTLSAYVRERERENEPLPEEFIAHIDVQEEVTVRGRTSD